MPPCHSGAVACWLISHWYSTRESDPAARPYQDRQINRIFVLYDSCAEDGEPRAVPGQRLERCSSKFKAWLSWPVDDPGVVTRGLEPQPPAL